MLTQDIAPSRIRFSTIFAERLVREMPGWRFAIFPFSGEAYLQTPLTEDQDAVSEMLTYLAPDLVTNPTSDIQTALARLWETLSRMTPDGPQIVLFSDGEFERSIDHQTLTPFIENRIPIHTVGVGTRQGSEVPTSVRSLGYSSMKSHVSRLDDRALFELSRATGGTYREASLPDVTSLRDALGTGYARSSIEFAVDLELFPYLILLGILLFGLEFRQRQWRLLLRATPALAFLATASYADSASPRQAYSLYNQAIDRTEIGAIDEATELFQSAAATASSPELRKRVLFNLGNLSLIQNDPELALDLYQRAYDIKLGGSKDQAEMDRRISENMAWVAKQMAQAQSGEGEGKTNPPQKDPSGPQKNYREQAFSETQKRKLFELVVNEERQVLQRIFESRSRKSPMKFSDKPW